jgi:hypothetical protein
MDSEDPMEKIVLLQGHVVNLQKHVLDLQNHIKNKDSGQSSTYITTNNYTFNQTQIHREKKIMIFL